jgi:purine-cytosine permease-like protein
VVGLIALAQVEQDGNRIFDLFIGLPLGTIAFAVLVIRETDQSFANVYSTALSIQNLRPTLDRRVLTVALGALVTAAALVVTIGADYANFLYLIGGVFVPLSGLMVAAWLRTGGSRLDLGQRARTRPGMLVAWALGFVLYQCINPGALAPWSDFWSAAGRDTHLIGHPWLSASVASFGLALLVAWPFAGPDEFPSSTSGETDQAGASAQIMPSSRPS